MQKRKYFILTATAMLVAVNLILTRILPLTNTLSSRLSLGNIPIYIAGIFFGPLAGGVCGLVSDVIGCVVFGGYAPFPALTVSPVMVGVVSGFFSKFLHLDKKRNFLPLLSMVLITDILFELLWKSFGRAMLYGTGFGVQFMARLIEVPLEIVAEVIILFVILKTGTLYRLFGGKTK